MTGWMQEDMKMKITISTACILGLGVAIVLFLPPPIEGYYRSDAATCLDGESTGYLLLRDGKVEVVNFSSGRRSVQPLGIYTTEGRSISVSDQVNSNEFTGKAFLWGIHWHTDAVDKFTRRAFPE